ncbi:hypothetical protein NKI56_33795 [Mesorhizobium sp. M0622]|uniref:hypothetical protein n=1 Tax=unclassified Mesorhizobium TaxID=325217 RepID=UPI00333C1946
MAKLRALTRGGGRQRRVHGFGRRQAGLEGCADLDGFLARDLVSDVTVAFTTRALAGFHPDEPIEPKRKAVLDAIEALEKATEKPTRSDAMRSRGPTPARIDREWPYQIALPDDLCTGHSFALIREFCEERGLVPMTRQVQAI